MYFRIKTYSPSEGVRSLSLHALNEIDARRRVSVDGRQLISIRRLWKIAAGRNRRYPILEFSQEMLALLDAGLSLTESLEVQSTKAQRSGAKQVLTDVLTAVRCGLPFSAALAECPDVFSPLFIAIVKASEQTGDLAETLRSYITYQQQADTVRNRVASAAIYPLLLIGVGALVIAFLLVYVIPRFSRIYEDLGKDLPWSSRLMISWSHFVSDYGSWMLMVILCLCGGAAWLAMAHATRATAERIIWRMPAIGEKTRLYQLARFTRTLAMLTRGGVPFVSALGLVSDLLRQPALHAGLQQAKQSISEGKAISVAFAAESLATEVGVRLLAVAEHSGSMGASLERIAQLYDDELARWVDRASKLFEPILMLVIGAAIGLIVLLMYMPIFELANSIQ